MSLSAMFLRPRSGSAFTPRLVPNLAAWYDATVSSSLYTENTGGSLAGADQPVMRWEDLSGNANHLTQPGNTTNNAPIRKVASVDTANKDSLLFDGSNDVLQITTNINTGSGGALFIVHKRTANADKGLHSFTGASAPNHHPFSTGFYDSFGNTTRRSWTQAYSTNRRLYSVVSGTTWAAYINGTSVFSASGTTPAAQFASRAQYIGAGDNTQIGGVPGGWCPGYICEVVIYTRAISASEHSAVSNYLISKWSL